MIHQCKEFLIKTLSLAKIEELKSNVKHPVIHYFLSIIDKEILKSCQNNLSNPVNTVIIELLNGPKSLSDLKLLALMCRKSNNLNFPSNSSEINSDLKAEGIIHLLKFLEILGAKIEILVIYNALDFESQYLLNHSQTKSIILRWSYTEIGITYYNTLLDHE